MSEKTIFERLDEIDAKLDKAISGSANKETIQIPRENPQMTLQRFVRNAKKEYCWMGQEEDFIKEKSINSLYLGILIGMGLLSTIVTTTVFKWYSTFTLFENIWLIMMMCTLKYTYKAKYYYDCFDFSLNSYFHFELDGDGIPRYGKVKKRYKWFIVLTCISALCNIIVVWGKASTVLALFTTLFELGFAVFSIFVFYKSVDFFWGYNNLRFTGINETTRKFARLYFSPRFNKLYTEEDYIKQFSFCK